jgi:hypothetical protein
VNQRLSPDGADAHTKNVVYLSWVSLGDDHVVDLAKMVEWCGSTDHSQLYFEGGSVINDGVQRSQKWEVKRVLVL